MKWKYEVRCLLNTPALRLQSGAADVRGDFDRVYLRFENDRFASIFGLCVLRNAFPADRENVKTSLHYGIRFWAGAYSLKEYAATLSTRKTVMLLPRYGLDNFSLAKNSTDDRVEAYMKNAAGLAAIDGYDPSEIIVCCTGGEELYGISAGFVLADRGYIIFPEYDFGVVNNFVAMNDVPDLVAVRLGDFQNRLIEEGFIEYGGWLHEIELFSSLPSFADKLPTRANNEKSVREELSIALEVEDTDPEASNGYGQVEKYVASSYFDGGMLVCPQRTHDLTPTAITDNASFIKLRDTKDFLLMTWDREGSMPPPRFTSGMSFSEKERKGELLSICRRLIASSIRKAQTVKEMESW